MPLFIVLPPGGVIKGADKFTTLRPDRALLCKKGEWKCCLLALPGKQTQVLSFYALVKPWETESICLREVEVEEIIGTSGWHVQQHEEAWIGKETRGTECFWKVAHLPGTLSITHVPMANSHSEKITTDSTFIQASLPFSTEPESKVQEGINLFFFFLLPSSST